MVGPPYLPGDTGLSNGRRSCTYKPGTPREYGYSMSKGAFDGPAIQDIRGVSG
jgi:hypothetical protein